MRKRIYVTPTKFWDTRDFSHETEIDKPETESDNVKISNLQD